MQISNIPFGITDWSTVERTEHKGEIGLAYWRTQNFGVLSTKVKLDWLIGALRISEMSVFVSLSTHPAISQIIGA